MQSPQSLLLGALFACSYLHAAPDPRALFANYAARLAVSTPQMDLHVREAVKTTDAPLIAYKVTYLTTAKDFMSVPNARTDPTAKVLNLGITKVWQTKFCSPELLSLMTDAKVDMVTGELQNSKGETQRMALCFRPK